MPFQIIRNDITKAKADAIVNTANPKPIIGGGIDSAIYKAAGEEELLLERKKIGDIAPGEAVRTAAFCLHAKYIIHTVGPAWIDGKHGEREILHACYRNSLHEAAGLDCACIAFPLIATGVYGFPKDEALQIALEEISRFLLTHDMQVILVVFDRKAFELSGRLISGIEEFIDDNFVRALRDTEYQDRIRRNERKYHRFERTMEDAAPAMMEAPVFPDAAGKSLDEFLDKTGDTFRQKLFQLIDERGMDDVTVYKKANIDRKVFSRIRCKEDYKPKKKTAVALCVALELDMQEMLDLLARAEIAFSPSSRFDMVIAYFITKQIYDIFEINAALFKYGLPILGE